jgi:predicted ester cyclase
MSADNVATLMKAVAFFNRAADHSAYFDLYAPGATIHGIPPGGSSNLSEAKEFYRQLWLAFPDGRLEILDAFGEVDRIAARYTYGGTHEGDFMGTAATGKAVEWTGITILRFTEGRCVERWNEGDYLGLMQRLGAIPSP